MNDVSPGKLTTMIGAAVAFVFSFLPWYSFSGFGTKVTRSAWGSGLFPMATWAPIFALVVAFIVACQTFKFLDLPEKIWEFTLDQVVLVLAVVSTLITLSYLIVDKGGAGAGFGLILCLLGSAAMIVGFFLDRAGVGTNPNAIDGNPQFGQPGFPPPSQQPGAPQAGGYPDPSGQMAPPQAPPTQAPPTPAPSYNPPPAQAPPVQAPPADPAPSQPQPPTPPQQPGTGSF